MFAVRPVAALFALGALAPSALAYNIVDTFVGSSFLSGFDHQAIADPTHGRVKYVVFKRQGDAAQLNV